MPEKRCFLHPERFFLEKNGVFSLLQVAILREGTIFYSVFPEMKKEKCRFPGMFTAMFF